MYTKMQFWQKKTLIRSTLIKRTLNGTIDSLTKGLTSDKNSVLSGVQNVDMLWNYFILRQNQINCWSHANTRYFSNTDDLIMKITGFVLQSYGFTRVPNSIHISAWSNYRTALDDKMYTHLLSSIPCIGI